MELNQLAACDSPESMEGRRLAEQVESMTDDSLLKALKDLEEGRDECLRQIDVWKARCAQNEEAISQLHRIMDQVHPGVRTQSEFEGMGITEATERLIKEKGPLSTAELSKEMLARGLRTKSKRLVPTVYATLTNSVKFVRQGDKWDLKQKK